MLLGPDGVVLRVERTAICGSDLHLFHGDLGTPGTRLGHEFVGTVEDAGPEVETLRPGDRVLVSGVVGCGTCRRCRSGDPVTCELGGPRIFGTGPELAGGQAEAVAVPAADAFCLPVPKDLSVDQAVLLTDILPTGFLGAQRADILPGSTVAVIGLGPVGILALQCAWLFGPSRVLALDTVADRLARAESYGAEPLDAGASVQAVLDATEGRGVDAVIEAVGADQTVIDAVMMAAAGGTVSVVGANVNMALPFPMALALLRRLTFRVTLASIPSTWTALVPLVQAGRLRPEEVVTDRLGLSEAQAGYERFDTRCPGVLKVMLDPTA